MKPESENQTPMKKPNYGHFVNPVAVANTARAEAHAKLGYEHGRWSPQKFVRDAGWNPDQIKYIAAGADMTAEDIEDLTAQQEVAVRSWCQLWMLRDDSMSTEESREKIAFEAELVTDYCRGVVDEVAAGVGCKEAAAGALLLSAVVERIAGYDDSGDDQQRAAMEIIKTMIRLPEGAKLSITITLPDPV